LTADERQTLAGDFVDAILEGPMAGKTPNNHVPPEQYVSPYQAAPANNAKFWVGLIACVLVAIAAQAHTLPEPWSHIVSMLGTVGAAVNGYLIRR
jgi:hypothetical protein